MPWWSSSCGRIELKIPSDIVRSVARPGSNDAAVDIAVQDARIRPALAALDREVVRRVVGEYGDWSDAERRNDDKNLQRLLWLACWDIEDKAP